MKHGFYISGIVHVMLISLIFTNGFFFTPDMRVENFEEFNILILSEAEFDAMISLPPTVESFSNSNFEKLKNFSQDSKLNGSIAKMQNFVTKHDIAKLNFLNQPKEEVKLFTPTADLVPDSNSFLETKLSDDKKEDFEFNKLGNEIGSLDTSTIENPKSREADTVDRIASDDKKTQKISDNLTEILEENSEELELKTKKNSKEANKEATTKITPDAQKNVDIIKGVVEKSVMPLTRSTTKVINTAKIEKNIDANLQNTINKLVESVNEVDDNGDDENKTSNPTISTIDKLKLRKSINQLIGKYWNKGILIGGSDFENYVVKVEILLDNEGNIQGSIRPISPSIPYGRYAIAFREASNAIKAVGRIPLPTEKYKKGLKLKLTFDPALGIGFD